MKLTLSSLARIMGGLALGLLIGGSAHAGIANTKHNLSSGSGATHNKTDGTDQICVFCHTPHGADTSAAVPLWNKALPSSASYTLYNGGTNKTSSLDGEILTVGSVSIACLSCHDGTQAMDNMINKPGSGGYTAGGSSLAGTWTAGTAGNVNAGVAGTGNVGKMKNGPVPVLGTDLSDDHPIGIAYCGGGLSSSGGTTMTGTCNDSDFVGPTVQSGTHFTGAVVKTKTVNSTPVFWVETDAGSGVNSTREKTDIALYTRNFTSAANTPSVECGSCHDPHVESKGTDNIMFMRVTTANSAICLSCHVK